MGKGPRETHSTEANFLHPSGEKVYILHTLRLELVLLYCHAEEE